MTTNHPLTERTMKFQRPTIEGTDRVITTPAAEVLIAIFGCGNLHGVHLTREEWQRLMDLYGFDRDFGAKSAAEVKKKHDESLPARLAAWEKERASLSPWQRENHDKRKPAPLSKADLEGTARFADAGTAVNLSRWAVVDAIRVLAVLTEFSEGGEDPVKTLLNLASLAGLDTSAYDYEWFTALEAP